MTFHHRPVPMQPNACGVGPLSEQQAHGTKKDALARARLTCENVKPFFKIKFHLVDEGVVVDVDAPQHQPKRSS